MKKLSFFLMMFIVFGECIADEINVEDHITYNYAITRQFDSNINANYINSLPERELYLECIALSRMFVRNNALLEISRTIPGRTWDYNGKGCLDHTPAELTRMMFEAVSTIYAEMEHNKELLADFDAFSNTYAKIVIADNWVQYSNVCVRLQRDVPPERLTSEIKGLNCKADSIDRLRGIIVPFLDGIMTQGTGVDFSCNRLVEIRREPAKGFGRNRIAGDDKPRMYLKPDGLKALLDKNQVPADNYARLVSLVDDDGPFVCTETQGCHSRNNVNYAGRPYDFFYNFFHIYQDIYGYYQSEDYEGKLELAAMGALGCYKTGIGETKECNSTYFYKKCAAELKFTE
ncbi:MAG: hypothetical protein LBL21_03855 [Rickettsiales bacterium]|jgi:hypothetical protein|nr:hypothetical protein [Rickettsiales bacterium]